MSKQLIIVRHGKSDHGTYGITDFERPLNVRGNENAPEMAARLKNREILPDLLVSSPAKRALSTAKHFAAGFGISAAAIQEEQAIYEADSSTLLNAINRFDNKYNRIFLFGHNPGLTDLLNYLTDANLYNLPTAGIAVIDFPSNDWTLVSQYTGNLLLFDFPKNQTPKNEGV